jgi:hypothetical protein
MWSGVLLVSFAEAFWFSEWCTDVHFVVGKHLCQPEPDNDERPSFVVFSALDERKKCPPTNACVNKIHCIRKVLIVH